MKKIRLILCCAALLLAATGCGKETLTCTMSSVESGMKLDQNVVAEFNNNVVTDMDMDLVLTVPDEYASYMDTLKSSLESEYKKYSDNGAKLDITSSENKINIKIVFDVAKMTYEQKQNLDMTDTFGTKSATAKELEKQGYSCK